MHFGRLAVERLSVQRVFTGNVYRWRPEVNWFRRLLGFAFGLPLVGSRCGRSHSSTSTHYGSLNGTGCHGLTRCRNRRSKTKARRRGNIYLGSHIGYRSLEHIRRLWSNHGRNNLGQASLGLGDLRNLGHGRFDHWSHRLGLVRLANQRALVLFPVLIVAAVAIFVVIVVVGIGVLIIVWIYELNFYLRVITFGFVAGTTVLDAVNQPHEELAHRLKEARRALAQGVPEAKQSVTDSAKAGERTFALRLGLAVFVVLVSKLRVDLVHDLFARGHALIDNLTRGWQNLKALEQARATSDSSQLLKLILILERRRIAVLILAVVLIVCDIGFIRRLIYIVVFRLIDIGVGGILRRVLRLVLVGWHRHMRLFDRSGPYVRGLDIRLFNVRLFVFGVVVISRSKLFVTLVGRLVFAHSANDGLTVVVTLFVVPVLVVIGIVFLGLKIGLHHKLATDATRMRCRPLLGIVVCGTNHVEHAEHCRK